MLGKDLSKHTLIVYGDATIGQDGSKGNRPSPTSSVRKRLGKVCRVVDQDEFRSSKLCSACRQEMQGFNFFGNRWARDDLKDRRGAYSVRQCLNHCTGMM
jgi:hypothetical protein